MIDDNDILFGPDVEGQRPIDIIQILHIDVVVHHDDPLRSDVIGQGGQKNVPGLSGITLLDADHNIRTKPLHRVESRLSE